MMVLRLTGIILIALGIVLIVFGGFSYQQNKKVLDTDVVDITAKETKIITWPPVVGSIVILGGIAVLIIGRKRR